MPQTLDTPAPAAVPPVIDALLIAGGETDPNTLSLLHRAHARGIPVVEVLAGPTRNPALTWDVQDDTLRLDGRAVRPGAAFVRYDVFQALAEKRPEVSFRAQAWYTTLLGWMLAHDDLRMMNRGYSGQINKPYMLSVAARCGLRIPRTVVTNELDRLETLPGARKMIAKPVPGGGYTQLVGDLLDGTPRREGKAAAPAFVQQRLVAPEVRIYGVGGRFIPFRVVSDQLDYRTDSATEVIPLALDGIDPDLLAALARLMDRLGMEYGASDFKTDPETGALVFLEINSGPMFVAFDRASGHAVSDAILDYLTR